tara:strand:+ start:722 stop:1543 length:822 start_codon:yes stop_codon:yes gene_type:complete
MTFGGEYSARNYTVRDLRQQKGTCILAETLPFTVEEAMAAEEAGIDTMKVRFNPCDPATAVAIRRAAPKTFMAFSVPLTSAATNVEAVRLGLQAMELGADAIMCQWPKRFIESAAEVGIPVQGHVGLIPRKSTWTGGLRAAGNTIEQARWVFDEIKALENAGAYAVEVEVIPEDLLIEISKRTNLITSSIGAGRGGDIIFLFAEDILGNHPPPHPRHSKQYRNIHQKLANVQRERVAGFQDFINDVRGGGFPETKHTIKTPDGLITQFLDGLD